MNNKELTELKKIEEIKKDVAEIINNNTVLKEHAVSEDGEEYDIEYIVVIKSPFDLQTAIVDYITKTTPDEIKREAVQEFMEYCWDGGEHDGWIISKADGYLETLTQKENNE